MYFKTDRNNVWEVLVVIRSVILAAFFQMYRPVVLNCCTFTKPFLLANSAMCRFRTVESSHVTHVYAASLVLFPDISLGNSSPQTFRI
jgi:hypothetical protein